MADKTLLNRPSSPPDTLSGIEPSNDARTAAGVLMNAQTDSIFTELGLRYDPRDLYQQVISLVLESAQVLELPHHLQLILAEPKTEVTVHFPVKMDNNHYRLFEGYRVQHNNILGPYKGGIRYHANVGMNHIKALSVIMTMKCALVRLPLGGAKGGVQVDPHSLSEGELTRLTRRFVAALGENIGPDHDIPAPDMGTNARIMAWMADTYLTLAGPLRRCSDMAVVTGKPVEFGGSFGRDKATGQGLVYVLEEMLPDLDIEMDGMSVSLIGYGNVGAWTGRLLTERGARLHAVLDHTGAILNEDGLDAAALAQHVARVDGVAGFKGGQSISDDQFYSAPVDVLIPAALEQMIDEPHAKRINCKVVVEAANAPTTPGGQRILDERGIAVLPAILCNAGGVTVSYFEWKQNRQAETWDAQVVDKALHKHMYAAAQRVKLWRHRLDCDVRTAVHVAALEHIGKVYHVRGIFP